MATKYSFDIAEAFPNQDVDSNKLCAELAEVIGIPIEYINTSEGVCDIWFESELPLADSTSILPTIITAHDGISFDAICAAYLTSNTETLTTSINYIRREIIQLTNMQPGDYEIMWYFEYSYGDNVTKPKFKVELDDTEILAEFGRTPGIVDSEWISKSGFAFVNLTSGSHHVDIDYASGSSEKTLRLRRVRVAIESIEGFCTRTIREIEEISELAIII